MAEESLYSALGVSGKASAEEIHAAYRTLAYNWESWLKTGEVDRARVRGWAHAYLVLSDPESRERYDGAGEDPSFREKLDLALDLSLKGYDDEMLEEYLRRLSFSGETVGTLVSMVSRAREGLDAPGPARMPGPQDGYRKVEAVRGWQWVKEGFLVFRRSPLIWVVLCMIMTGIGLLLSMIPLAGEIVLYLASPLFAAGLLQGCRDLEEGGELELSHLFLGFRKDTSQLLVIGAVYLIGQMVILGIMISFGGDEMTRIINGSGEVDFSTLPAEAVNKVMIAMLIGMAVSVPLMMMIWFAPMLVVFRGMKAKGAMQMSFHACLGNMLPFMVIGGVFVGLAFFSVITFGLGLMIMIPLVFTSSYASYMDIFENRAHLEFKAD